VRFRLFAGVTNKLVAALAPAVALGMEAPEKIADGELEALPFHLPRMLQHKPVILGLHYFSPFLVFPT